MSRRFRNKVGVGQQGGDTIMVPVGVANQMYQQGYLQEAPPVSTLTGEDVAALVNALAQAVTGRGWVPNMGTGPGGAPPHYGYSGGGPDGIDRVPFGPNANQQAFDLANLKYQQEQQLQAQSASQRSESQSQAFSQSQQLKNQEFNQRMAELERTQADKNDPYSGLIPRYAAPSQVPGPNGAVSMFDPSTGMLIPVFQGEQQVRIEDHNLIVPPGQQAQVYYAGNGGQPTNVSGGPGTVTYPQQLPFSGMQQAQQVAPLLKQQQGGQQGGMGGFSGAGGYGGQGGGMGSLGGAGRSFGQPRLGGYGGRTFGSPMGLPQPMLPYQPPQQSLTPQQAWIASGGQLPMGSEGVTPESFFGPDRRGNGE